MTLVSSKEFIADEDKYFDLALNGGVCIQRGDFMYHLVSAPFEKQYPPQPFLEPDEDLRNAISMDELRKSAHAHIRKLFANLSIFSISLNSLNMNTLIKNKK